MSEELNFTPEQGFYLSSLSGFLLAVRERALDLVHAMHDEDMIDSLPEQVRDKLATLVKASIEADAFKMSYPHEKRSAMVTMFRAHSKENPFLEIDMKKATQDLVSRYVAVEKEENIDVD